MKKAKRIAAVWIIMSIMLMIGVSGVNITIEGGQSDAEYAAYRLLIPIDLGADKYSYAVNEKYRGILTAVSGETEDEAIIDHISNLAVTDDVIIFADSVYAKLIEQTIETDGESVNGVFRDIEPGYYLIASKNSSPSSVVIVDTAGKNEITIKTKENVPSVTLKLGRYNADSDIVVGDFADAVDAVIGEEVKVQIECDVPKNYTTADKCNLDIFCNASSGIQLMYSDGDEVIENDYSNVVVKLIDSNDRSAEKTIFEYNSSDEGYVSITSTAEGIKVNVQGIGNVYNTFNFDSILIETSARLNEKAVATVSGNPITAYVQYPRESGSDVADSSAIDKAAIFTYKLILNNYDGNKVPLYGAGYKLSKKVGGQQIEIGKIIHTDSNIFEFIGLSSGEYILEQTQKPDGYNRLNDMTFTVTAELEVESDDPRLISLTTDEPDKITVSGAELNIDVFNRSGIILPSTGGSNDYIFYLIGISLIAAGLFLAFLAFKSK